MGVEQNNFRHMLTGYLSGPPQTQHMFGIFPAALVAHTGLAGEERLKAFPLQILQRLTALCLACLQSGKPDQEKTCRP